RGNQRRIGQQPTLAAHDLSIEGRQVALTGRPAMDDQMGPGTMPASQRMRQPGRDPWMQQQQQQQQTTFQGQVQNVREVYLPGAPPQHTIVQIRLQDGRTELVNLGRQVDVQQLDIRPGDQISLRGEETYFGNELIISAATLNVEGQQYNLGW